MRLNHYVDHHSNWEEMLSPSPGG